MQTKTHSLESGGTLWFTGLSGAGKSTLSCALKNQIDNMLADN